MAHPYPVETQAPAKKPFEDDFIMLSEFSEQEGPKPLVSDSFLNIVREFLQSFVDQLFMNLFWFMVDLSVDNTSRGWWVLR